MCTFLLLTTGELAASFAVEESTTVFLQKETIRHSTCVLCRREAQEKDIDEVGRCEKEHRERDQRSGLCSFYKYSLAADAIQ